MSHKNFIKKMKQSELITNNLNLNPGYRIHHKWFLVFIFFGLKFLLFGKTMNPSSSSLSRLSRQMTTAAALNMRASWLLQH